MTDRELMQQALEALVQIHPGNMTPMAEEAWNKAIVVLGERLAQPEQEPVKFLANGTRFKMSFFNFQDADGDDTDGTYVSCFENFEEELDGRWVALVPAEDDCHRKLTTPPRREWVGVDDVDAIIQSYWGEMKGAPLEAHRVYLRAIEAKLKEKNG